MIELILAALATFRLSELIVVDEGPLDVFKRLRVAAGVYNLGEDGLPDSQPGRLLSCPYCVGVWIAFFVALAIAPMDWRLILYWLGIAGAQAVLQSIGGRQ